MEINKEFWKRIISENQNAIWIFVDGSQRGIDILYEIFQCFEKKDSHLTYNKSIEKNSSESFLQDLDLKYLKKREFDNNGLLNENEKKYDLYYERFANPRKLIAIPRL